VAFAAMVLSFFIGKALLLLWLAYVSNQVTAFSLAKFTSKLFLRYLEQPYAFHLANNSARLIKNLQTSAPQAMDCIRIGLNTLLEIFLAVAAMGLLVAVEPMLTLMGSVALLAAGWSFHHFASPAFRRWGELGYVHELRALTLIRESLSAIRDVQLSNCKNYLVHLFSVEADANARYFSLGNTNLTSARLFLETMMVAGILAMMLVLIQRGADSSETIQTVGLFALASMRLLPSANRILGNLAELRRRTEVIEQIIGDMRENSHSQIPDMSAPEHGDIRLQGTIEVRQVAYRYPGVDTEAIAGISFTIEVGETVGLIGPSGAGKSTLVDVLLGLLSASAGTISVGNVDIRTRMTDWQRGIGYVPQHIQLLDDTVRHNIAFGQSHADIDDDRVRAVLKLASLEEVVAALPEGLNTRLGENGTRLSGGQRQRIGIARALYTDPSFLVFDEATSGLDNETEQDVVDAISSLKGTRTILIIAHRLSTVRDCDRIFLLKDGAISDSGSLVELASRHATLKVNAA